MASATVAPPTNGQHALVGTLVFIGLVVAAVGSLGAPLVRTVAVNDHVSLAAAQWTLTISLLGGAVSTPVLGRIGDGPRRRAAIITTLGGVLLGSILTTLPLRLAGLVAGRGFQGMGLGLTALVIGVARDAFRGTHSQSVIGLLSVTSVAVVASGIRDHLLASMLWARCSWPWPWHASCSRSAKRPAPHHGRSPRASRPAA